MQSFGDNERAGFEHYSRSNLAWGTEMASQGSKLELTGYKKVEGWKQKLLAGCLQRS